MSKNFLAVWRRAKSSLESSSIVNYHVIRGRMPVNDRVCLMEFLSSKVTLWLIPEIFWSSRIMMIETYFYICKLYVKILQLNFWEKIHETHSNEKTMIQIELFYRLICRVTRDYPEITFYDLLTREKCKTYDSLQDSIINHSKAMGRTRRQSNRLVKTRWCKFRFTLYWGAWSHWSYVRYGLMFLFFMWLFQIGSKLNYKEPWSNLKITSLIRF